MAKANRSYSVHWSEPMATSVPIVPRPIAIPAPMLMVMARYLAKKAIKQRFRSQGRNPVHIASKVIAEATWAYLDDHRAELMQEAEDFIARSPGLREMAEKEVRRRAKAIQKTSLQQQANSSTATTIPRALPAHTAIDRLSNRQST